MKGSWRETTHKTLLNYRFDDSTSISHNVFFHKEYFSHTIYSDYTSTNSSTFLHFVQRDKLPLSIISLNFSFPCFEQKHLILISSPYNHCFMGVFTTTL